MQYAIISAFKTRERCSMKKLILGLFLSIAFASAYAVDMLSCCPGENTATEARFVWHSGSNDCTLWYAKASAPNQ